jgi:hypothetical protein
MGGIRLSIRDGGTELAHIQTRTVDDFYYFRDSLHEALEGDGDFGSRFPTFMKRFEPDEWAVEELDRLIEELETIAAELRKQPPRALDPNWRGRERGCASLFEVFVDARGRPLVGRILDLVVAAKKAGKPVAIDGSPDIGGKEPPLSGRWGPGSPPESSPDFATETAQALAKVMAARERSDQVAPVPETGAVAPGPVSCRECDGDLGAALRPGIVIEADGARQLIEMRPCAACDSVTIAVFRKADGRVARGGPTSREQAEAWFELPPYCETPGDAGCGCESHRFFRFLYFKYGWGDV